MILHLLSHAVAFYVGMIVGLYLTAKTASRPAVVESGWRWFLAPIYLVKAYLATR